MKKYKSLEKKMFGYIEKFRTHGSYSLLGKQLEELFKAVYLAGKKEERSEWMYELAYYTDERMVTPKGVADWVQTNLGAK